MHTKLQKERAHLGDIGVGGRIIVLCILREIGSEIVEWIQLVQDRDHWQ
jgi:hypothetical protein